MSAIAEAFQNMGMPGGDDFHCHDDVCHSHENPGIQHPAPVATHHGVPAPVCGAPAPAPCDTGAWADDGCGPCGNGNGNGGNAQPPKVMYKNVPYQTRVPSTKTIMVKKRVPTTIRKHTYQTVPCTKMEWKRVPVQRTRRVRRTINVQTTKCVMVPTQVPTTKCVTKFKRVPYVPATNMKWEDAGIAHDEHHDDHHDYSSSVSSSDFGQHGGCGDYQDDGCGEQFHDDAHGHPDIGQGCDTGCDRPGFFERVFGSRH